jgi:hypothetical protein
VKKTKMVCAPIATLALIGSLTGGANAAILFNFQEGKKKGSKYQEEN